MASWHPYALVGAVFCMVLVGVSNGDIFTSLLRFEKVLHTEDALADHLQDLIKQEEDRLNELIRIAEDYKQHSKKALSDAEDYLANPLNAFLLIKRFTTDWQKVAQTVKNQKAHDFVNSISSKLTDFPDANDLIGSARALLRLQDTYALETEALARGEIRGVKQTQQLDVDDCYELGRIAYEGGDFYHSILWFQQAVSLYDANIVDNVTMARALDYLAISLYRQGNLHAAINVTKDWIKYDPGNARAHANMAGYERELKVAIQKHDPHTIKNERNLQGYRMSKEFAEYEKLCRGEKVKENPFASRVYCKYEHPHPYYILRPLKTEVMYLDPYVVVYHDLIVDSEIEKIKEVATPMLHTSILFKPKSKHERVLDDVRVSMSAWVEDAAHRLIQRVSKKVEYATGLDTYPAEELQVLNYGLGGHYEPHLDFAQPKEDQSGLPHFRQFGNRISTSLYYMTDVAAGGGTVFTVLGLHVAPEKGSMLHWYNLHKSGEGDYRTRHAGCPVLAGTKWVCNKWIHEKGQEFRRPCSLNELE